MSSHYYDDDDDDGKEEKTVAMESADGGRESRTDGRTDDKPKEKKTK